MSWPCKVQTHSNKRGHCPDCNSCLACPPIFQNCKFSHLSGKNNTITLLKYLPVLEPVYVDSSRFNIEQEIETSKYQSLDNVSDIIRNLSQLLNFVDPGIKRVSLYPKEALNHSRTRLEILLLLELVFYALCAKLCPESFSSLKELFIQRIITSSQITNIKKDSNFMPQKPKISSESVVLALTFIESTSLG
jgi:hypothetical protein